MVEALRRRWFCGWFTRVIERRLRATFSHVAVHGLAQVRQLQAPMVMIANHSSYWDALLISWLSERVLQTPGYAWMHAHNLARLPFFRLLGAFGVDGKSIADVKAGMAYVANLLGAGPCALWIFPQGDEKPAGRRPLGFAPGSAWIARRCPQARVVPVALHYGFGADEKPYVQVCFGAPLVAEAPTVQAHEAAVTKLLDACMQADPALEILSPGRQIYGDSREASYESPRDPWATRCLSAVSRWYLARGSGAPKRRTPLSRRAT